jgi:beta-phosphoglucomutase-like phosphatase (HAD superfamily)
LNSLMHEAGVERSIASLKYFSGRSHTETLAELEAEVGVPLLTHQVERRMDECYTRLVQAEGLRPCHGVPLLLLQLTACQIPSTLASSGRRKRVQFSVHHAGLAPAFPHFVCADDVSCAKPAPDLYLAAAAIIGVPPRECLAVEDAPNRVRAGMQVVAVTTSFPASALTVDSLSLFPLDIDNRPASWLERLEAIRRESSGRNR